MRNHALLFIASILLILISLSGAYAQDPDISTLQNNSSVEIPIQNSTSANSSGKMKETVINGTVNDCKTKNPFPGVNISVSENSKLIASAITKADGSYYLSFLSNNTNFNVTASHLGHYSVTKEVTLSALNDSSQYGTVNFQLGATIYVNGNTGNDGWDGTSPTHTGGSVGPKKTIKSAISASQNGGTISIAAGTYKGDDNRHLNINNKTLTIIGNGTAGAGNTTIDPEQNDLIFFIGGGSNSNVTIQNLTFTGGEAHGTVDGDDGDDGGAIYNEGKLTIDNCLFIDNHAKDGTDANPFSQHAGHGGDGGAIYNKGTLIVTNSNFKNNHAGRGGDASDIHDGDYGGSGGAIYSAGTLNIQNCTFQDNYAGDGGDNSGDPGSWGGNGGNGGAIYVYSSTVNITDSYFNGNYAGNGHGGKAAGNGGAIYNNGNLTILNSNISTNLAGNGVNTKDQKGATQGGCGGGIYNSNTLILQNCTFGTNHAGNGGNAGDKDGADGGYGGAIYNGHNILNITDCIFNGNYAGNGGSSSGTNDGGDGEMEVPYIIMVLYQP